MALTIFVGSWVAISHIIVAMVGGNDLGMLSTGAVVEMIAHCVVLMLLLAAVSFWYWVVAIYKETPAGMPTSPAANP